MWLLDVSFVLSHGELLSQGPSTAHLTDPLALWAPEIKENEIALIT